MTLSLSEYFLKKMNGLLISGGNKSIRMEGVIQGRETIDGGLKQHENLLSAFNVEIIWKLELK